MMKAVLNEVRSRHRIRSRQLAVAVGPATTNLEAQSIDALDVIEQLPPRQRAAAFLVFHQEYTPAEAATLMGCRPATVRRYVHLAREKLKEALDE
jgi:RNA polymerase sigma factor (sigma-70 family)